MRILHLVYIHGFQGNDTTFQTFPADLQNFLSMNISAHYGLNIRSSLYPTYKSIKPLSFATKNFLGWLSTQPAGPVILLGHSMGGLLAAEAANHASNNHGAKPSRIVGIIAFDTPFLGMHPHVVITGLTSVFRDGGDKNKEARVFKDTSEVGVVDQNVADDWETFKKNLSPSFRPASISSALNPLNPCSGSPTPHLPSPSSFINETMSSLLSSRPEDPFFRWARKHANEPFSASKRWIVEHFQFGSSMFDPNGLKERYSRLVAWQGLWVNYWTQTVPNLLLNTVPTIEKGAVMRTSSTPQRTIIETSSSTLSITLSDNTPLPSSQRHRIFSETQGHPPFQVAQRSVNEKRRVKPGRHFVVLPNGLGEALGGWENWENVLIGGVEDEVAAHCGLFIRGHNLDYDGFVERVGRKVLAWCETI